MPLVSGKKLFTIAHEYGFCIGAFNFNNLEFLKAILETAEEMEAPVFVQTTESAIRYAGMGFLTGMVKEVSEKFRIPFALHLDHGKEIETVLKAIRYGYTSIMIDYSDKSFEENVEITRYVVSLCAPLDISVEGELGILAGMEDEIKAEKSQFTDPEQALKYINLTGIDALAPAVGTAHGVFKYKRESFIDINLLMEIKKITNMPLVLHGASSVYEEYIRKINTFGGEIKGAKGVSEDLIREAIEAGINKINTDTDLRLAFIAEMRKLIIEEKAVIDPRKLLKPALEEVKNVIRKRILLYGSEGKACLV